MKKRRTRRFSVSSSCSSFLRGWFSYSRGRKKSSLSLAHQNCHSPIGFILPAGVEPDEDRLRRERDPELGGYSLLNLLHQPDHFTGGRAAAIDNRQRMFRRDSHSSAAIAFLKPRALNQPGGGDFHPAVAGREIRNRFGGADQVLPPGDIFDGSERVGRDDGIFEKRSRASAIGIPGRDQHRLSRANLAHGLTRHPERRPGRNIREKTFEIGIADRRLSVRSQRVSDHRYDVSVASLGVEDAGAITETALLVAQFGEPSGETVKDANGSDRLAHLLPVSADILNGRAADTARNPAQTFDARQIALDTLANKLVPILAGHGNNDDPVAFVAPSHAFERHMNDQPRKTFVGDQRVAPAAENEERKAALFSERKRREQFIFLTRFGEKARRAADPQRCQRRERYVLLNQSLIGHRL